MEYRDINEAELKITKQDEIAVIQYFAKIMYDHDIISEREKEEIIVYCQN